MEMGDSHSNCLVGGVPFRFRFWGIAQFPSNPIWPLSSGFKSHSSIKKKFKNPNVLCQLKIEDRREEVEDDEKRKDHLRELGESKEEVGSGDVERAGIVAGSKGKKVVKGDVGER